MVTLGTSIKAQDTRRLARAAKVLFVPDNDEGEKRLRPGGRRPWGMAWCFIYPRERRT